MEEPSVSPFEKDPAELSVEDVYDISYVIGRDLLKIGCREEVADLQFKIVRVLEVLESLVNQQNLAVEELKLERDNLRTEVERLVGEGARDGQSTIGSDQLVIDLKDPNRPRFTLQELRDVLQERNQLKAQLLLAQEELQLFKSGLHPQSEKPALDGMSEDNKRKLSDAKDDKTTMMDPGQDLLLAALSESGISPNDLFDVDPLDSGLATPIPSVALQQSVPISALELGLGTESAIAVKPDTSVTIKQEPGLPLTSSINIRKPQPSTTTFVLNQLNQLPSLGTMVVTRPAAGSTSRPSITMTKIVHGTAPTCQSPASPGMQSTLSAPGKDQIQLKDLLKNNSLNELMKLKPPSNIAQPVATATTELNNGVKKEITNKEVARIWVNDDLKVRSFSPTSHQNAYSMSAVPKIPGIKEEEEQEEDEEEELGHAETYAEYMPMKLKIGLRHPDQVVETSSLSSVSPPNVWYRLSIPEETIDRGWLSALQLEAITYAAQQHETFLPNGDRAAYLIGDGAGVGKGRTIAGIIYENYLLGRKRSLWFSVSNDLKYDAERDLRDIGAKNIQVHSLNKIIFDECHKAKNVCPIGSSKPTKTGLAVLELQNKLPKARVVYASATGASEPRNMAYMNRLGIWGEGTPFKEFSNFIQAVERRGVGAMEIVAMDMKLRGMYIARQLSFAGVTFKIEEVPLSQDYIKMYNKAVRLWVSAREKFQLAANLMDAEQRMKKSMWGQFWSAHQRFFKYLCIASKVSRVVQLAREEIKNGKCVVIGLQSTGEARTLEALEEGGGELNDFVSTAKGVMQSLIEKHFPAPDRQKLFSLLGIDLSSKKTPPPSDKPSNEATGKKRKGMDVKKEAKKPRKSGGLGGSSSENSDSDSVSEDEVDSDNDSFKSVSSGEDDEDDFNPFRDESSEDEEDDPWLIRKEHKKNKEKKSKKKKSVDPDSIQSALLASGLGSKRPSFSSQAVKSTSSVAPSTVKKESDTSSCVTSQDAVEAAQQMKRELLEELEKLSGDLPPNTLDELIDDLGGPDNVAEMTGRKGRVVSNDDGSISYESRSELDVPVEILNITEKQRFMDGEKGALTHGDRRATESRDLSRFNFDNKYGRNALEIVMKSIVNFDSPIVSPPASFEGDFFKEIRQGLIGVGLINVEDRSGILSLDKDYNHIGRFLNRILGMEVQQQNALFQYFSDTLNAVIQNAKKNGRYDMGILDLGSGDEKVKKSDVKKFLTPGYSTSGHVELYTVSVERGMSWEDAMKVWAEQSGTDDGFYLQIRNNKKTAIIVKEVNTKKRLFLVYRPNTGKQLKMETYADIRKKCKKVLSDDAKQHWMDQYISSADICSHAYWRGNCKKASIGLQCEVGLRCRTYFVLCGSVLSVWTKVEGVLASVSGTNVKMQIVRLRTEDGQRIVGLIIPANCVSPLINILSSSDQSQQIAVQQQQMWQQLHPQSINHFSNT
ncbi:SBNO1 protein, partial [Polypterus senegalus]